MNDETLNIKESDPTDNRQSATSEDPMGNRQSASGNGLDLLRRFVRSRAPAERCDLCSIELSQQHPHLIEPATRRLVCACQACAILFSASEDQRYRRVPERVRRLSDFQMSDVQWEGMMIPINMAFFFRSSAAGKVVVLYPSPAGATESLLDFASWEEIVKSNPILSDMEPDTEALLVNRVKNASNYYIVPIDECFRLVGLIRLKWKGLAGGTEVWEAIDGFFDELKKRSTTRKEVAHA